MLARMFPDMRLHRAAYAFVAIVALPLVSESRADFIAPYDVPTGFVQPHNFPDGAVIPVGSWTLNVSGDPLLYGISLVQTNPSQVSLTTGIPVLHGSYFLDLQFTHTILGTGTLSFDYSLSLQETTGIAAGWNSGGYVLDGVLTQLPAGTGSVTLPVNAGDVFGFEAFATGNCFGCGPGGTILAGATSLTITNFNAPVPEPTTVTLFACGAACSFALRLRRRLSGRGRFLRRS